MSLITYRVNEGEGGDLEDAVSHHSEALFVRWDDYDARKGCLMLRRLYKDQPESFAFSAANQAWAEGQISKFRRALLG